MVSENAQHLLHDADFRRLHGLDVVGEHRHVDVLTPEEVRVVGAAMAKVYREIKGADLPPLPGG